MTIDQLSSLIIERFGFEPTDDQRGAIATFGRFLACKDDMPVMLMRGSAGTGKTSLVAAMVNTLKALGQRVVLMAPTGRAAKVLDDHCNTDTPKLPTSTIHRKIYRQKSLGGGFSLNNNLHKDTLFVVDEASMISTFSMAESPFGSGNLLDDLIKYVYSGQNCRMMLLGDTAQLPPIGEDEAPALMSGVLYGYGLTVFECDLSEVLRQGKTSGILWNANAIRQLITHNDATQLPKIRFNGFADIKVMPGNELIESLANSYARFGVDESIVVTRSNNRATIYNNGIRNTVLDREEDISSGDQLMVVKNHYEVLPRMTEGPDGTAQGAEELFIANGDRCTVIRIRHHRELYGFHFVDALLRFPDMDDLEIETILLTDTLQTSAPALTAEQSEQLLRAIEEDYMDIPTKAERMKAIRENRYFNALQVKFAYAVTCHKAQGGQWSHVYVDQGYMTDEMLTPDYIHWLYTAFTRATDTLYLVNWPKEQILE